MAEEKIEITFENNNGLTPYQKAVVKNIFNISKDSIKEVVDSPEMADALVVTIAVGNLVKLVDNLKINSKPLSGSNKKAIVLFLGRLLLNDLLPESRNKANIIGIYDLVAEQTLEKLIDVSSSINVVANNIIDNVAENIGNKKCCLFPCLQ